MNDVNTNKNINNKILQQTNYIIDGDVDGTIEDNFFSKLKTMLNDHNDDDSDADADNCCLLTKELLDNIHIKLECGHKFNYVPLYREVVMQKTTGMSSIGYYQSHSLKRNEIKCPYCRTIQDKLLPYLEYDGVNKTTGVNQPKTLSMSVQTCSHIEYKKGKKQGSTCKEQGSTCKEQGSTCKENAIHFVNGAYLCKKHSLNVATNVSTPATIETIKTIEHKAEVATDKCGVIIRYGKNKGNPCKNSSKCRVHSKIIQ